MIFFARWTRPSATTDTGSCGTDVVSMPWQSRCMVVAGVAGFKAWTYWQERQAQQAGAEFSQALARPSMAATPRRRAKRLDALAAKGPAGYRVLARFQLASAEAQAGDIDKAVADYDALSHRRRRPDNDPEGIGDDPGRDAPARYRRLCGDGATPEGAHRSREARGDIRRGSCSGFLPIDLTTCPRPRSNSARSSPIRERRPICGSAQT